MAEDTISVLDAAGMEGTHVMGASLGGMIAQTVAMNTPIGLSLQLDGAPPVMTDHDATPFIMVRKDRVTFLTGIDRLNSFRLPPDASSERVVATCCNTPVYLEFKNGHWLSLYGALWAEGTSPPPKMPKTGEINV